LCAAAGQDFAKTVRPFLDKTCVGCHNAKLQSGSLDLQSPAAIEALDSNPERWERLRQRLVSGEMPPKPLPRPKPADVQAVAKWIDGVVEAAEKRAAPDPGHITARRLNRAEYNNTVRDLLGFDVQPANDFPEDNSAYGFDSVAEALSVSPLLMEKYMASAEKLARLAVFGPEFRKPSTVRFTPTLPRRMETNPEPLQDPPFFTMFDYDRTGLSHPGSFHGTHRFPATGEYLLRFIPNGSRPRGSEPQEMNVFVDGKLAHTFVVRESRTVTNESMPVPHEFRMRLTAGAHDIAAAYPRLFEGLPPAMNGPNPSKLPQPPPPDPEKFMRPLPPNPTPEQIAQRKARIAALLERFRNQKFEGVAVGLVEIVGPYDYDKGPLPGAHEKVFTCGHAAGGHNAQCLRSIAATFARRAYRRPVSPAEVNELVAMAERARTRGRSFEQAVALLVETVLVSPDFLFRIEEKGPSDAGRPVPITPFQLASRLSYFLWSSMPDQELMQAAAENTLRKPAVLKAQVERMLRDPRAEAFVSNFTGQWLETRRLEGAQPDRDRFPDFDDLLRKSMVRETEVFFGNLLRQNGSLLDLLQGDYTFVNERLARHYGIKGVAGEEFRRVSLAGTGRAGVLTQASVLTVSSYNNRTSPVLRGKWVLENLLNAPPPPPPANVPALDEAAVGATASLRQQMEKHRANAVCASCHARMDPIGFALENYNGVGVWRTRDGKFEIDPSGTLPDGRAIGGPADLSTVLAADRDAFTRALTEKLLVYALGRGVAQHDRAVVKQIANDAAKNDYRISSVILGIVNSLPFQMRRAEQGTT
jgi:mono/diheme cytochrome c family protein